VEPTLRAWKLQKMDYQDFIIAGFIGTKNIRQGSDDMENISGHELRKRFEREHADKIRFAPDNSDYIEGLWDGYKSAFKSLGVLKE